MSHTADIGAHSVTRIDSGSAPRVLFSGDQFIQEHLPIGTTVISPKAPIAGLEDPDAAIRYALNHPVGTDPLHAKLWPGMKVTIAFDDVSLPLPPMRRPDVRQRALEIVLDMLGQHGVDDVHLIAALAIHRRMTADELRHVVGDRIFNAYYPERLYNHDAEDPDGMVKVGLTDRDEYVDINRRAAESDLIIYVNLNLVPMDGGHKSVAVGLSGYKALRSHHNPKTMRATKSYMDPNKDSELHNSVNRQGRVINAELNVFNIEMAINNRMFDGPLGFLQKNEDLWTDFERTKFKGMKGMLDRLPQPARQEVFERSPAAYELIGVWAGETEAVHKHTVEACFKQYAVQVKNQADIMIAGIPFVSPYNVGSYLNPLLVQVMAQGYLFNLHRGAPLLKKNGTLIITHPMLDKFSPVQHPSYIEFVHRLLPETRDAYQLHKRYERRFAEDPTYVEMYRKGNAYHGAHPFFMWYWGERGRQHIGRVIVAGAQDEYMCELFGYEPARNLHEAIDMARDTAPQSPEIACFKAAPIVIADVKARPEPESDAGTPSADASSADGAGGAA